MKKINKLKAGLSTIISHLGILIPLSVGPADYLSMKIFWQMYVPYAVFTAIYYYISEYRSSAKHFKDKANLIFQHFSEDIKIKAEDDSLVVFLLSTPLMCLNPLYGERAYFKKCLFALYPIDLQNILGFKFIQSAEVGLESFTYKKGKPLYADFENDRKAKRYSYGLDEVDLNKISQFKSGIAFPVFSQNHCREIKGVISMYSEKSIKDTRFKDKLFSKSMVKIANTISLSIME